MQTRTRRSSPGNITELAPGKYRIRYTSGYDENGVQKMPSENFVGSRRDAERRLAKLVGSSPAPRQRGKEITVARLLAGWFQEKRKPTSSDRHLVGLINEAFAERLATELTARDVRSFYAELAEVDYAQSSIHKVHSCL